MTRLAFDDFVDRLVEPCAIGFVDDLREAPTSFLSENGESQILNVHEAWSLIGWVPGTEDGKPVIWDVRIGELEEKFADAVRQGWLVWDDNCWRRAG